MNGYLKVNENGTKTEVAGDLAELTGVVEAYKSQGKTVQKGNKLTVTRTDGSKVKIEYRMVK